MTVTKDKTNCNGFGERLTEVIRRAQVTRENFAKDLGYGLTALKSWISGETSPNLQTILKICDKYKVNLEWLATGAGTIEIGSTLRPEGLSIKIYDVKLSAGPGCFATDENLLETIVVPSQMVNRYNLNSYCVGALIDGVSMEPKLHDGDIVIIDRSVDTFEDDNVYAFFYDDHCYIKQLQKLGNELKVKSLNPDFDSWIIHNTKDIIIAGKYKARFSGNIL